MSHARTEPRRFAPCGSSTTATPPHDLTYDDVFMVPRHSAVASRYDVDLATSDGTGATLPLVVANMTAIAGKRMAETVARRGGLAVIPQDIPIPVVADVVRVREVAAPGLRHPDRAGAPTQTVAEALSLIPKRSHRAAVVVDDGRPVGVVTEADCAEVDRFAQVQQVMRARRGAIPADTDPRDGLRRASTPRAPALAVGGRRRTAAWSACSPAPARCAPRSTPRPSTPPAGCGSPPRSA